MVKISEKMKVTASMVKTILEGMFNSKVETGWSFSKDTYMLIYLYDKDNKYDYEKFEIEYVEDKDDADYCSELVNMMLNGICDVFESTPEQRLIQDILEQTGCKRLFILDGRLCDSDNEISVNLGSLDIVKYDCTECNFILIEDTGDKYEVDMCEDKIYFIEDK